jgi:hypothetical protein
LKILHVGKYFQPFCGGLENYMRDAMSALGRHGIESVALVHKHSVSYGTVDETITAGKADFLGSPRGCDCFCLPSIET